MNASQIILLIAAFLVISMLILIVNTSKMQVVETQISKRTTFAAINEAKNLIDEIKVKKFDENVGSNFLMIRNNLTRSSMFGPENESYPNFDDIDDYHNFTKDFLSPEKENLTLRVTVNYVNEQNPEIISTSNTFYKLVTIRCFRNNQQLLEFKNLFSVW